MANSVREMAEADINLIISYFLESDAEFLKGMGVDINKLPGREEWYTIISEDLRQPMEYKRFYYLI